MTHNKLFVASWLLLGTFLFLVGRDWFLTIPEFGPLTLFNSVRAQILLLYALLAMYIWVRVFRYGSEEELPSSRTLKNILRLLKKVPSRLRIVLALSLAVALPVVLLFSPLAYQPMGYWPRAFVLLVTAMVVNLVVNPGLNLKEWAHRYVWVVMLVASAYFLGTFFTKVNSFPFSIGWSEGNRLWDYSIRFGSDRYILPAGEKIGALISPGKEILMGLPFLLPNINIFGMRLWVSLVQMLPPVVLGFLFLWRNEKNSNALKGALLFAIWTFMFLLQAPIQPPLVISAIIVILGVRSKNIIVAIILIAAAGYYANISRWTWTYAPGLWAGMIALLSAQTPTFKREDWGKLRLPILLGIAGYFGGQIAPKIFTMSHNYLFVGFNNINAELGKVSLFIDPSIYSTFSQAFLWDRLLPNSTFLPGIFLALFAAVGPLLLFLSIAKKRGLLNPNRLQVIGISVPILIFLVVGLIASVKIGGGGDLHNLDMFFIAMLILAAYAWPKILEVLNGSNQYPIGTLAASLMLITPIFYNLAFLELRPLELPTIAESNTSLDSIRNEVLAAQESGEVLFMDQRQLLTFGFIEGVILITDYEKKYVIDYAMSQNLRYFERFYTDLKNQRFVLIVSEPLHLKKAGDFEAFGQENDVWVEWVSEPMLRYYKVLITFPDVGVQLLVPRLNVLQPES